MPRQPKKNVNEIFESLKDLNFFNDKGHIVGLSDPIWKEAENALNKELTKKYLYLYISQNRNGILERFQQAYNVVEHTLSDSGDSIDMNNQTKSTNESNESKHSNWSISSPCRLKPWRTVIHLTKETWHNIITCETQHEINKKYTTLNPGWTNIIYDEIWKQLKLPCCYAFKSAKINRIPGEIYLKIKGTCAECGAHFNAYSMHGPRDEDPYVVIHISTYDTRGITHNKKRQLRNIERSRVVKDLHATSAYGWRRERAKEIMTFGDIEPAHLYSESVLRKAKQLDDDKKLGLGNISDPIASVLQLKYKPEFSGIIHEIGLDKFFVIYFSPEQLFLYKKYNKQTKRTGMLSIDATGSLIKSIKKPDESTYYLFLYQAVVPFKNKILPVLQMVSEKHDTNILTYWLREWLRSGASCPNEVAIDYSFALLNAATLAFNDCNLITYVENCMKTLQENDRTSMPKCLIRIDIAHLIKMVCRWKCFKNKHARVKDFFVRCIGALSKTTTFDSFNQICLDVLTVAFSETEDICMNNDIFTCFNAQQRLLHMIKTQDIQYCEDITNECQDEVPDNESCNRMKNFLDNIERNSKRVINTGDRPNPYYCHAFGINLLRICKEFPLWTAVMDSNKITASSARSEEYFNEVKNLIFGGRKNIRVDKFLISHIRSLAGTMNILNADGGLRDAQSILDKVNSTETISDMTQDKINTSKNSIPAIVLNEVETWKKKKSKRGKYLKICPDIVSIHNKPQLSLKIPLLQNGNMLRPQKIARQNVMITNTCAFDAIVQSLLVGYRDWTTYYNYINSISSHKLLDFVKLVSTHGILQEIYKERALIMSNIFNRRNGRIDCACNISTLLEKHLMQNISSYEMSQRCSTCEWANHENVAVIQIGTKAVYENGMRGLQEAIQQKLNHVDKICKQCTNNTVISTVATGAHLIIDVECLQWTELATRLGYSEWSGTFTLSEIPDDMQFSNIKYKLVAAIEYKEGVNRNEIGHYIAHCRRIHGTWEIYDDLNKRKQSTAASKRIQFQKKKYLYYFI